MSCPPTFGTVPAGKGPGGMDAGGGVGGGGPAGRAVAVGFGFGVAVAAAVAVTLGTTVGARYGTVGTGPACESRAGLAPQPLTTRMPMSMPQLSSVAKIERLRIASPIPSTCAASPRTPIALLRPLAL